MRRNGMRVSRARRKDINPIMNIKLKKTFNRFSIKASKEITFT